jgi:hypothetical protein
MADYRGTMCEAILTKLGGSFIRDIKEQANFVISYEDEPLRLDLNTMELCDVEDIEETEQGMARRLSFCVDLVDGEMARRPALIFFKSIGDNMCDRERIISYLGSWRP